MIDRRTLAPPDAGLGDVAQYPRALARAAAALRALVGRAPRAAGPATLVLMHAFDPRGAKIGGIETHARHVLAHAPPGLRVLHVGVDERGDLALGRAHPLVFRGRPIEFLPVARVDEAGINAAARRLGASTTLAYVRGLLAHLPALRRAIGRGPASADLHRFEYAPVARLLGLPFALMVHGEGTRADAMDSLIRRHWWMHRLAERVALSLAARVVCVNASILARHRRERPRVAARTRVMSAGFDAAQFAPQPFDLRDGVLRIAFAGRLDAFKDPPLIFEALARLSSALNGRVELHYVGASDPGRFVEFAAVADRVVRHGPRDAAGVAGVLARCHAGVLASHFEGMPCFLLEGLSVGRPFAAVRLPQYDPLIVPGVSGRLVERAATPAESADRLASAFLALWDEVRAGAIDPARVAALAAPHAAHRQLAALYEDHRLLAHGLPPLQAGERAAPATASNSAS